MFRFYDSGCQDPLEELVEQFNTRKLIWVYIGDGRVQAMDKDLAPKVYHRYAWSYMDQAEVDTLEWLNDQDPIQNDHFMWEEVEDDDPR